jgi:hypothetical protein
MNIKIPLSIIYQAKSFWLFPFMWETKLYLNVLHFVDIILSIDELSWMKIVLLLMEVRNWYTNSERKFSVKDSFNIACQIKTSL